jgi:hypothetical protein
MNANQQAALESLAGRAMTAGEIALASARDDADLATSLSVGRTATVSTKVGIGAVLNALGAVNGAAFLDAMEALAPTVSPIKWGLVLLDAGVFDVGDPVSIAMINQLVPGSIPQATATLLLALAVVPAPISTDQVSAILNGV